MIKWIRRRRNSWGYGVQSPSDFYFVQHVLREQSPYYAYDALEEMARRNGGTLLSYPDRINRLLFRLANHVHPDVIVEVGAGLSIFAMATACPSARCVAIGPSEKYSEMAHSLLAEHPQVEVKYSDEMGDFCKFAREIGGIGLWHIAHTERYKELVEAVLPHVTDRALVIIEDICSTQERRDWWKAMQESPLTGISYDLGDIGLLFFDRSRHKDCYWIKLRK